MPLVWRSHYVAVLFDGSRSDVTGQLADKGFEVITFGGDEAAWTTSLDQLAKALGRPA